MSIKIQINSVAALERLFAGDPEMEIEVRQSAVAEYSKKYIKSMISDQSIIEACYKILFVDVRQSSYSSYKDFAQPFKGIMEAVIERNFEPIVTKLIAENMERLIANEIMKRLNK